MMGGTATAEKSAGSPIARATLSRQGSTSPTPSDMDIELLRYFEGSQTALPPSGELCTLSDILH